MGPAQTRTIDPHTECNENDKMRYCISSITGWRETNEDAHLAELDLGDGNALFGVFDGHGGKQNQAKI